jgi:hypothetical protein
MPKKLDLDAVYRPSEDVVARHIEDELIIVPVTSGVGSKEDELFTLNDTGRAIWQYLDGIHTIRQIISRLEQEYDAEPAAIETDVTGLAQELLKRNIIEKK